MKIVKGLLAACATFALMHTPTFAAVAITKTNFNPVEWHLTQDNGQYSIVNLTSRAQFVLVTLKKGAVGTFVSSFDGQDNTDCRATLSDTTYQHSMVCELKPNMTLNIDKDFSDEGDAKGTYQIEMSRTAV